MDIDNAIFDHFNKMLLMLNLGRETAPETLMKSHGRGMNTFLCVQSPLEPCINYISFAHFPNIYSNDKAPQIQLTLTLCKIVH